MTPLGVIAQPSHRSLTHTLLAYWRKLLVECAGLAVSAEAALDEDYIEYFGVREEYQKALGASSYAALKSALRKTWGLIDLIDNIIYLDHSVSSQKQGFLKLHEVGHKMLPWQRATFLFPDDKATLAPDIKALFELEANRFAAEVLFQGDRFTRQSRDLPLELETPLSLSGWYGSSAHAAIRRFVEVSHRCCAVLVLRPPRSETRGDPSYGVVYEVRSPAFANLFEGARFPSNLGPKSALGTALLPGHRYVRGDGILLPDCDGRKTECGFQTFQNSRNAFALVFPLAETMRRSRTKIKKRVIRM